jgi:UDP-N-acetylmuramoyl-L-alanyl-D-glutamate--2,6-diaminopimelate ligase
MNLSNILSNIPDAKVTGPMEGQCTHLTYDSRQVIAGCVFVAVRGLWVDGHDYVHQALTAGASVIIAETGRPSEIATEVTWVEVPDSEVVLGLAADAFHDHPSRSMQILATTGTNGKTTVSWLLHHILKVSGAEPGLVGTVEQRFGNVRRNTLFTTPPSADLHSLLGEMRDYGCTHAAIEASSHGMAMNRLAGVEVAVAGFSNLSRDHLDYHETMESYQEAKWLLFRDFAHKACFNIDDPVGALFHERFKGERLSISVQDAEADLRVHRMVPSLDGCELTLSYQGHQRRLQLPLVGAFNVQNACVAAGLALLSGLSEEAVFGALETVTSAPGRLEIVPGKRHVVVDYAHTPDALDNVLQSLAELNPERILCVFGAGGDRDPGKRPQMAQVVEKYADVVVVTSDNPRTEEPQTIIDGIMSGLKGGRLTHMEVDRAKAIEWAIRESNMGDVVLIAGKGHEDYQIIGTEKRDFDDRLEARKILEDL